MDRENDVVIVGAARTPIGTFNGQLSSLAAHELGTIVIQAALQRANLNPEQVNEVLMGQVLTAGVGQNPARQAAIKAGIPVHATAMTVNQVCGSGLRSVALAYQSLRLGDQNVIVAGGQESMSQAPHVTHLRQAAKMGHLKLLDTMLHDGLWDAFNDYHMGHTAENIAQKWQISRQQQDELAYQSQQKAQTAIATGRFLDEIVPVTVKGRKGDTIVAQDEYPKSDTTLEGLAKLRPAFDKNGTVTAGNASGINDGAAAVVLMRRGEAQQHNIQPLARIASWATDGVDPAVMGSGPIPASRRALAKANWHHEQLDLIESNEAFAAQACAVNKDMGWDQTKVNVNGGAIALGHPIGASGTRVLITLLYELQKRQASKGLATLCIGGGMGIAMCIERD